MGIYYKETEASKGRVKNWSKRQGLHIAGAHHLSSLFSLASKLHSLLSPPHGEQCHIHLPEFHFLGIFVPKKAVCLLLLFFQFWLEKYPGRTLIGLAQIRCPITVTM